MLKILKYGLIGWLALSLVTLPLYWPYVRMIWVFLPKVESPNYETPATQTEARLQDLDYLSKLTKYDRAFSDEAKSAFAQRLDDLKDEAAEMTDAEFYLGIAESIALADNGHTNVSYRAQYTEFSTIGARLYGFDDGVFVLSAAPDNTHTLGRRVVAVDDIPIDTLRAALGKYRGGNDVWRTLYSMLIVESPELLAAAGHAAAADAITLTLESETGDIEKVKFAGTKPENANDLPGRSAWRTLTPPRDIPGFGDWRHVLEADDAGMPRFLADPSSPLSYALDDNGFYVRALPGFAVGDQSIKGVYKSILSEHAEGSLDYLVIDFRLHDGGDYLKSMPFAKAAPHIVKDDGKIYIVTGPNTFSAGIVTVAMLKYYAGDRGVIIGEPIGDREQFWAERGTDFRLPNSGYYVNYATGYHDWKKGCKGEPYCYTMNELHEVPAGPLTPEIMLPQDFESYRRGEDVVMDWIAQQH